MPDDSAKVYVKSRDFYLWKIGSPLKSKYDVSRIDFREKDRAP